MARPRTRRGNIFRNPLITASAEARAFQHLSTPDRPVTMEILRAEPSITAHLKSLGDALLKEVKTIRETVNDEGRKIFIEESITPFGIGADLTKSWPKLLDFSELPPARRIMALYNTMPVADRVLPIEAYCYAAQISPSSIFEVLIGILSRLGVDASAILTATWHPRVVEKTIERALQDGGFRDREVLHKATGFLPMPKGTSTTINIQQNASRPATAAFVPAPSPESTVRQLADTFNEAKGLPPVPEFTHAAIDVAPVDEGDSDEENDNLQ